uniref:Uncharacterized protein n=1 Tax=Leersia perrieri TaxID=77586 RepID=A0A0D9W3P2_9ORYZ
MAARIPTTFGRAHLCPSPPPPPPRRCRHVAPAAASGGIGRRCATVSLAGVASWLTTADARADASPFDKYVKKSPIIITVKIHPCPSGANAIIVEFTSGLTGAGATFFTANVVVGTGCTL